MTFKTVLILGSVFTMRTRKLRFLLAFVSSVAVEKELAQVTTSASRANVS